MSKTSGLGDNLYVTGTDCSNDVGALSKIACSTAVLDVTGINKFANERLPGLRDGQMQFAPWFNKTGAHAELSLLPTADIIVTYCRGTTIGNPAAALNGRQLNYDGKRDNKGGLTLEVTSDADAFGLEWGVQLTAGIRTDTTATNGTSFDQGAPPAGAWGAQAYAHFFAMTSTSCVVKVQHSTDNSTFTDLITFAAVATAGSSTAQRVATSNSTQVNRYLRAVTTGTFTSAAFAVMVNVNQALGTVF
jgi:hypothetical protein